MCSAVHAQLGLARQLARSGGGLGSSLARALARAYVRGVMLGPWCRSETPCRVVTLSAGVVDALGLDRLDVLKVRVQTLSSLPPLSLPWPLCRAFLPGCSCETLERAELAVLPGLESPLTMPQTGTLALAPQL